MESRCETARVCACSAPECKGGCVIDRFALRDDDGTPLDLPPHFYGASLSVGLSEEGGARVSRALERQRQQVEGQP